MKSPRSVIVAALVLASVASQAHALTGAICVSIKLNGSLKLRATGVCKSKEIQLGSFDGTTLQFSGINLQVVSGSGKTDGTVNGKGNLIVGYDEPGLCNDSGLPGTTCRSDADCGAFPASSCVIGAKTGSHNLVVGAAHGYSSYGGLVAGELNVVSGPYASVTGGSFDTASGTGASVSGGRGLTQPAISGWAAGSAESGNVVVGDFESP